MVTALNTLLPKFCADWSLRPVRLEMFVPPAGAAAGAKVPAGAAGVVYISDAPDVAGVYGYHDETDKNVAIAKVFTQPVLSHGGQVLAGGPMTVAQVFSHEVLELLADAQCNTWWQTLKGDLVAFEVCDPVQMNVVKVRTEPLGDVWCSDWILPAWADAQAKGVPLNHLNTLKTPFSCATGGYLIRMAAGRSTAVFAAGAPQWLEDTKRAHAQRMATRGATMAGLLGLIEPKHTLVNTQERKVRKLRSDIKYFERQERLDREEVERLEKRLKEDKERLAKLREKRQAELGQKTAQWGFQLGDDCAGCPVVKSLQQQIKEQQRGIVAAQTTKVLLLRRMATFADSRNSANAELQKLLKELEAASQHQQQQPAGIKQQTRFWF